MMRVRCLSGTCAHTMHGTQDAGNACSTWLWRTGLRTWLLRVDIWHHSHAQYKRRCFQTTAPNFLGTPCIPVISSASAVPCLAFGTAVLVPSRSQIAEMRSVRSLVGAKCTAGHWHAVLATLASDVSEPAAVVQATQAHRPRMTRTSDIDESWCAH
jgi:hypothetical protein